MQQAAKEAEAGAEGEITESTITITQPRTTTEVRPPTPTISMGEDDDEVMIID
jgi:hypothetical protein